MNNLIYNAIRTPDGTILESRSVHDYQGYTDANGKYYAVDGGLEYLRRSGDGYEELSLTMDDDFAKIRQVVSWGTRGKHGSQPLKKVKIKDMELQHINAVLELPYISNKFRTVLLQELKFRKETNAKSI